MREPPFINVDLTPLELTFPCIFPHNFHLSLLVGRIIEQGRRRTEPTGALHCSPLPNMITPEILHPPHLPLIPHQDNFALHYFAFPRASLGIFPLRFAKSFLRALTLFLLWYWLDGGEILDRRRRSRSILIPCSDGRTELRQRFPMTCRMRGGGITWGKLCRCCAYRREGTRPYLCAYLDLSPMQVHRT